MLHVAGQQLDSHELDERFGDRHQADPTPTHTRRRPAPRPQKPDDPCNVGVHEEHGRGVLKPRDAGHRRGRPTPDVHEAAPADAGNRVDRKA